MVHSVGKVLSLSWQMLFLSITAPLILFEVNPAHGFSHLSAQITQATSSEVAQEKEEADSSFLVKPASKPPSQPANKEPAKSSPGETSSFPPEAKPSLSSAPSPQPQIEPSSPKPTPEPSPAARSVSPQISPSPSAPATSNKSEESDKGEKKEEDSKEINWRLLLGVLSAAGCGYLIVFWLRPLWLLSLPSEIPIPEMPFLPGVKKIPVPILQWFKYRPRVLDAWVQERIEKARKEFEQRETVKERQIYVPLPVMLGKERVSELSARTQQLRQLFDENEFRLLILGEGGVGKTSLACQIAKWAMGAEQEQRLCNHLMLPVLIEDELAVTDSKTVLLDAIMLQLKNLRDDATAIPEALLKKLLEKRRILVIVDHLSEMNEISQKVLKEKLGDARFPINALIVTSRVESVMGREVTRIVAKPMRVSGNQLSNFMDTYLQERGVRSQFDDDDYFHALLRLSQVVTDERDTTILFAKLYAEQMIAAVEGPVSSDLPDNIPDLMLSYLNDLNRNRLQNQLPDTVVHRNAKLIAWMCLQENYRPGAAEREAVLEALCNLNEQAEAPQIFAAQQLSYLEKEPLHLLRIIPPAKTHVRLALDPLAEYLAALYKLEELQGSQHLWEKFLRELRNTSEDLEEIEGFLLALRDVCIVRSEYEVPRAIVDELSKMANLDLEKIEEEQCKKRIKRLEKELYVPEIDDRLRAVEELGKLTKRYWIGTNKLNEDLIGMTVTSLLKALDNEACEVRRKAIDHLCESDWDSDAVIARLLDYREHENYEHFWAATALVKLGYVSESITQTLIEALGDKSVSFRCNVAARLGELVQTNEEILPILLDALIKDDNWSIRNTIAKSLGDLEYITENLIFVLVQALDDDEPLVRSCAAESLGKLEHVSKNVIYGLTKKLSDPNKSVRFSAVSSLEKLGKSTIDIVNKEHSSHILEELVNNLVKLLNDSSNVYDVPNRAAVLLGKLGNISGEPVFALLHALKGNESLRCTSAASLKQLGCTPEKVVPVLIKFLTEKDSNRSISVVALGNFGYDSEEVIAALLSLFNDSDDSIRRNAVEALGKLGPSSEEVIDALVKALNDNDAIVRIHAVAALRKLGSDSKEVIDALVKAFNDEDATVRCCLALVLGDLGNDSQEVITSLFSALNDIDDNVRINAARSIGKLGCSSEHTILSLKQIMERKKSDFEICFSIAKVLVQLDDTSQDVINVLVTAFTCCEERISRKSTELLGQLGTKNEALVVKSIRSILDGNLFVSRLRGVESLANINSPTELTVRTLRQAAQHDRNYYVRSAAQKALLDKDG